MYHVFTSTSRFGPGGRGKNRKLSARDGRERVRDVQLSGHDKWGLVRVYGTASFQKLNSEIRGREEDKALSEDVQVYYITCPNSLVSVRPPGTQYAQDAPYCFAQPVTLSHNSLVVKSKTLPTNGKGFGPGGRGCLLARALRARTRTMIVRRARNTTAMVVQLMDYKGCEGGRWMLYRLVNLPSASVRGKDATGFRDASRLGQYGRR